MLGSALPSASELPLVWFSKDRPSAVSPACVRSRVAARKPLRFDPPLPSVGFLPPMPFPTTLTGCSACRPTGLFRPVSGPGVQVVLLPASPLLCRHINRSSGRSSHLPSYPPKCSPRGWPQCVTAPPFPLAVAPFHRFQRSCARPQGFAPSTSPLSAPALPPCPTRYSLGLWSSSRFSLHPECSVERSRDDSAVTDRPWASPLSEGSLDARPAIAGRSASCACPPQSASPEGVADDAVMQGITRRPADLRQPAIEAFESAARALSLPSGTDSDGILCGESGASETSSGKSGVGFTRLHTAVCTRECAL